MTDHANVNYRSTSTSTLTGLTYLLIGGGIGAAAALLFAPKSGTDMRHDISDATKKGYDGTRDLAKRVKEQSIGLYRSAVERAKGRDEGANEILELETTQNQKQNSPKSASNEDSNSPAGASTKPRELERKSSAII